MRRATGCTVALAALLGAAATAQAQSVRPAAALQPDRDDAPGDYGFIDRADALWDAVGDAPPDYAFPFEASEPWAWETRDGHLIVVEESAGGISSYYFEPGARGPFLAVEPGRSFGFEGERLAVVYGPDGGVLPERAWNAHRTRAMALYDRARRLRRAAEPQQMVEVDTGAWLDASVFIAGFRQQWDEGRARHADWRRHRDDRAMRIWRRQLEQEQARRRGMADAFRRWREGGFQGPPPARMRKPGEHRPGVGRPRQPGQGWGSDRPRQPGQGWTRDRPRRGTEGRPERPRGDLPALPVPGPIGPGARPLPVPGPISGPATETGRPRDGRGSWRRGGDAPPAPQPAPPAAEASPAPAAEARPGPRWPRREGSRPDWNRPRPPRVEGAAPGRSAPPAADAPGGAGEEVRRPPRSESRPDWSRSRPPRGDAPRSERPASSAPPPAAQPAPRPPEAPRTESRPAPEQRPAPPPRAERPQRSGPPAWKRESLGRVKDE